MHQSTLAPRPGIRIGVLLRLMRLGKPTCLMSDESGIPRSNSPGLLDVWLKSGDGMKPSFKQAGVHPI